MLSKIEPMYVFGKSESEALELAINYLKENPIILSDIKKYNDLISAVYQIDGSAIRKNGDEIRYELSQSEDNDGGPVYVYASDSHKVELAEMAKVLLQDYVNRMAYEGGLETPQFNETVLSISSKIARLEGDYATQYEIQNKQFAASNNINFNAKPFLLRNGISISLSVENSRRMNDKMIIAYNKNNEQIIDGISNDQESRYVSIKRNIPSLSVSLNDVSDNANTGP
jgi:hypothetical protein